MAARPEVIALGRGAAAILAVAFVASACVVSTARAKPRVGEAQHHVLVEKRPGHADDVEEVDHRQRPEDACQVRLARQRSRRVWRRAPWSSKGSRPIAVAKAALTSTVSVPSSKVAVIAEMVWR